MSRRNSIGLIYYLTYMAKNSQRKSPKVRPQKRMAMGEKVKVGTK